MYNSELEATKKESLGRENQSSNPQTHSPPHQASVRVQADDRGIEAQRASPAGTGIGTIAERLLLPIGRDFLDSHDAVFPHVHRRQHRPLVTPEYIRTRGTCIPQGSRHSTRRPTRRLPAGTGDRSRGPRT